MRQPRGAHRGRHRREATQGRRRLRPTPVRPDAGPADQHQATAGVHRGHRRRRRGRAAEPARRRRHRRPAAPGTPHDQRWPAPPRRRRRRRHHERHSSTSTRPTSRCTGRQAPARRSPRPRSSNASSTRTDGESGVVAQSHAVVENLFGDVVAAGRRPERGRQEEVNPDAPWRDVSPSRSTPAFIADARRAASIGGTAWDFANDNRVPRLAASISWSSKRPASTAWPTPSRWRRRPGI